MNFLRLASRYAWALPNTCVGLLYALSFVALRWYAFARVVRSASGAPVLVFRFKAETAPLWLVKKWSAWGGHTFGHVIIVNPTGLPGSDAETLRHELVHVTQYEKFGSLFLVVYLREMVRAWRAGRDPYWENELEAEAYHGAAEEE